ncbi:MAG: exonuclease domain-containing protein [bacterium]|nr:exonuclease domain-containing protein [bacterium]
MNSAQLLSSMTQETLYNTPLRDLPYSVVDLETTGTKAGVNQIIEIGIVTIQQGQIIETYQTFLNPGVEIPPFISQMTGIRNSDVEYAPLLPDIAPKILPMLQDTIFVAHNAAFDYNFLQKNLRLAGFEFASPKICTVQLSRKLIPQLAHHTLDDLARHFHIEIPNRHRALDDALATGKSLLNMFDILVEGGKKIFGALQELTTPPETKKYQQIKNQIDELPFSPGVYLMKNADEQIIYIGKSKCLQKRVRSYFYNGRKTRKLEKLVQTVEKIEHIQTGSELSALLLESKKIKEHLPVFNKMIRDYKAYPFLKISNEVFPRIYSVRELKPDGATYYGPFKSSGALENTIQNLQKAFKLRPCKGKINPAKPENMKLCLYYELGECTGVCGGKMTKDQYAEIIEKAKAFLSGNEHAIISKIQSQIDIWSENLEFEKAAELRDNMISLERILAKQQKITKSVKENNVIIIEDGLDKKTKEIFCIKNGIVHSQLSASRKQFLSFENDLLKDNLSSYRYSYLQKSTPYFLPDDEYPETTLSPKEYSQYQVRKDEENRAIWKDSLSAIYNNNEPEIKVSKENIDDLMIISTWLMQNSNRSNIYFISDPQETGKLAQTLAEKYLLS